MKPKTVERLKRYCWVIPVAVIPTLFWLGGADLFTRGATPLFCFIITGVVSFFVWGLANGVIE